MSWILLFVMAWLTASVVAGSLIGRATAMDEHVAELARLHHHGAGGPRPRPPVCEGPLRRPGAPAGGPIRSAR